MNDGISWMWCKVILTIRRRFFEVTWHVVYDADAGRNRTEVTTTWLRRNPTYIRFGEPVLAWRSQSF